MKRLLYLHSVPVPSVAANAVQVAKMCDAFAGAGIETILVTPTSKAATADFDVMAKTYALTRRFEVGHMPLTKLPGNNMLFAALACLRYRPKGPLTVYTRAIPMAYAAHLLGIPYVLEAHVPVASFRKVAAKRLRKMVTSTAFRQLVTISDRLRLDYEANFPELIGRICVAHDGADPFDEANPPPPRALSGQFRVGYIGHLYPGKGMEIIVPLAKLCPWASFHIVGGRPEDINHWQREAAELSNLTFHGYVPHAETSAYLSGMDVVLAPYLRIVRGSGADENLADWMSPLKMFEYMAQGKAILASDLPVLKEVLRGNENALLCNPDDIASWVHALERMRDDTSLVEKISQRARSDFLASYSWDKRAERILGALKVTRDCVSE